MNESANLGVNNGFKEQDRQTAVSDGRRAGGGGFSLLILFPFSPQSLR